VDLNDAGRTVVLITHEEDNRPVREAVIRLRDGQVVSDEVQLERAAFTS